MGVQDLTALRRVLDLPQGLQPVTPFWVTPDDLLIVGIRNALAGVTVQAEGRIWTPDGQFIDPIITVSPGSTRALAYTTLQLDYGWLVAATVQARGATLPTRGQTYCTLQLGRPPAASFRLSRGLASGYISGSEFLSWPYGRTQDSTEGQGALYSLLGSVPAAGAQISQTVPTGARWRLRGMRASLTTAGGAGNRTIVFEITDGTNSIFRTDLVLAIPLGGTQPFNFIPGWPAITQNNNLENKHFIPPDLILAAGWKFGTNPLSGTFDPADQWTAPRFAVEEWLED